jgi:hypothetical protein
MSNKKAIRFLQLMASLIFDLLPFTGAQEVFGEGHRPQGAEMLRQENLMPH